MGIRLAVVTALGLAMLASATARAVDITFKLTTSQQVDVECHGPFLRTSPCERLQASGEAKQFYTADDNFLNPYGPWRCNVYTKGRRGQCNLDSAGIVNFCAQKSDVQLKWDGTSLTINQPSQCGLAAARAALSQDGEDASAATDVDTYDYAGNPGEVVDVRLAVDGSAGGIGRVATLRVLNGSGGKLGETTGPLPLRLRVTLGGPSAIVVERARAAQGHAFRGNYIVEVDPQTGGVGSDVLRPRENIEQ